MYEKELSFAELIDAIRRNITIVILLSALGATIGYLLSSYLPKRYKAEAVFNIQSAYFKNALVSELVSETHDPSELRSQRLAMVQLALSREYVQKLGAAVNILPPEPTTSAAYALEYSLFKERIEYFPLDASSMHISFQDNNPERAYAVTHELVARIREVLRHERLSKLAQAKGAIEENILLLGQAIEAEAAREKQANFQDLEKKIREVERELESLLRIFTEAHPKVQRLMREKRVLDNEASLLYPSTGEGDSNELPAFADVVSAETVRQLHGQLLTKLSNLSVAMELEREAGTGSYFSITQEPLMPTGAVFPSVKKFTAFGLILGILLGVATGFVREILRGTMLQPQAASLEVLEVPMLGEMPQLPQKAIKGVSSPVLIDYARKQLLSWAGSPILQEGPKDGEQHLQ